jgi:hypothetical protein
MLRLSIFCLALLTCSCSTFKGEKYNSVEPMYVAVDGTALWFQNEGTSEMVLCSGHTCLSVGQAFCDDDEYYCIDDMLLRMRIPKNLQDILPDKVTEKYRTENVWSKAGYRYEAKPFGGGRVIPTRSEYKTEMSIFGTERSVYQITSYLEGRKEHVSTVIYSQKYGILAIEASFAGNVYQSYWLEGVCGYLAQASECI